MQFISDVKKFILDILLPISCLGCGREDVWLCQNCLEKIPIEEFFYCPACKQKSIRGETHEKCKENFAIDGLIISSIWENKLLQKLIHKFKYNFVKDLKIPLGAILKQKVKQADFLFSPALSAGFFDCIVPVPLFRRRFLWRGFNQSELLACEVASDLKIEIYSDGIKRIKNTKPQAGQKKQKREENILGAFVIEKRFCELALFKDKKVLLVDDVYTTGSTMLELAKVLKQNNAKEVWGLVLTRG